MSAVVTEKPAAPALRGLLAELDSPGALLTAAEKVRDAGYTHWDTYSPFPVHGIDQAMGIRPTRLPWLVLAAAALGCLTGLLLQWWTNATGATRFPWVLTNLQGYPYVISDKPIFSLPANIPVIFEMTVLFAALAAVFGMFVLNDLPRWHRPLFSAAKFRRATSDRFFIGIDAADPLFDERRTAALLAELGQPAVEPVAVERILDDATPSRLPRAIILGGVIIAGLALFPPLLAAKARVSTSTEPRIQPIRDMGKQPRYQPQQPHPRFADGRSLRQPVEGTLARGDLREDTHLYAGKVKTGGAQPDGTPGGPWATTFPPQLKIDEAFVRRGQQRFGIYCAACHGLGGMGDGTVARRAQDLNTPGWVPPLSLHDQTVRDRPVGFIFNTITNGIRTMPRYAEQIPEPDRWAIIAYVRALERSQNAKLPEVPEDVRSELR